MIDRSVVVSVYMY